MATAAEPSEIEPSEIEQRCQIHMGLAAWTVKHYVVPRLTRDQINFLGGIEELQAVAFEGLFLAALRDEERRTRRERERDKPAAFVTFATVVIRRHVWGWVQTQRRHFAASAGIQPGGIAARPEPDPADRDAATRACRKLSDRERRTLHRRFWEDMTYAEIAKMDGVCPQRIHQIQRKAIKKCRMSLAGLFRVSAE